MFMAFIATGFTFGLIAVLFVAPYMLCKGVLMMNEDDFGMGNRIKSMIPIFNMFYAETQYGRSFPITALADMICFLMFIVNLILMFAMPLNVTLRFICLAIFGVVTIVAYVASCQLTATIVSATDELYGIKKVFYIMFFPVGYYYIGNYLYKFVLLDAAKLSAVEVE